MGRLPLWSGRLASRYVTRRLLYLVATDALMLRCVAVWIRYDKDARTRWQVWDKTVAIFISMKGGGRNYMYLYVVDGLTVEINKLSGLLTPRHLYCLGIIFVTSMWRFCRISSSVWSQLFLFPSLFNSILACSNYRYCYRFIVVDNVSINFIVSSLSTQ